MIPIVEKRVGELEQLCVRYNVSRLDLFGSAVTGLHRPEESDLDFLVEFQPEAFGAYADRLLRAVGGSGIPLRASCGPRR